MVFRRLSISPARLPATFAAASIMPSFLRKAASVAAWATNASASALAPSVASASAYMSLLRAIRPSVREELL